MVTTNEDGIAVVKQDHIGVVAALKLSGKGRQWFMKLVKKHHAEMGAFQNDDGHWRFDPEALEEWLKSYSATARRGRARADGRVRCIYYATEEEKAVVDKYLVEAGMEASQLAYKKKKGNKDE